jgi:hypothetical protein
MQTTAQPQADRQERLGGTLTISGRHKEFGIRACTQRDPDYFQPRSGGNSAGVLPFGGRPRIFLPIPPGGGAFTCGPRVSLPSRDGKPRATAPRLPINQAPEPWLSAREAVWRAWRLGPFDAD